MFFTNLIEKGRENSLKGNLFIYICHQIKIDLSANNTKLKGYICLVITSVVWGSTWVASKLAVKEIPALQLAGMRQLIAGTLLVSFFYFAKKLPVPTGRQFRWLAMMALLSFIMANGLSTLGIEYIASGLGALIGALYPLCVVLIERLFFKKKNMNKLTFVGLFLGIAGITIVFYENAFTTHSKSFIIGIVLSLIAMTSWSLGTVFLARNKENINPYYGIGWQMMMSSVVLISYSLFTKKFVPIPSISLHSWMLIFYLILLGSIGAFAAFIYSMKVLSPSIASLYAYINPLVAMLIASVVVPEKLTIHILWGSIVTLTGVYLVNMSVKKKQVALGEPEM